MYGHLVGPTAFKAADRGTPTMAGSIPVRLRSVRDGEARMHTAQDRVFALHLRVPFLAHPKVDDDIARVRPCSAWCHPCCQ